MKRILVVGFGAMGCRHVQSLLGHKAGYEIHVVEPSEDNIRVNTERIGGKPNDFIWHQNLDDCKDAFDLAIVATSSTPRYQIVKKLLEKGVKLFLLEKIVFQSAAQFEDILQMMNSFNAKAYCNFVNRYFNAYNEIREKLSDVNFMMTVHGGEFGLGCNAIHYIDIFQYLSKKNEDISIKSSQLSLIESENRRGKEYKEFTGIINLANSKGDQLSLLSEKNFGGGVTINIQTPKQQYFLSEQTQQMFFIGEHETNVSAFTILPTSKLTHTILQDIFSNNCRLTTLSETSKAHTLLFNCFNEIIYNTTDAKSLCPIT